MTELSLLLLLLLGHIIGDFYLQPKSWVADRNSKHFKSVKLRYHVLVHTSLTAAALLYWSWQQGTSLPVASLGFCCGIVAGSHFLIDVAKSYTKATFLPFIVDQLSHAIVLLMVFVVFTEQSSEFFQFLTSNPSFTTLTIIIGYLLAVTPTSILIGLLLRSWHSAIPENARTQSLNDAGHYIGILERLLIVTFVLLDELAGVGFLLAAKSIFRFGDLTRSTDKKLTEYVLLGTLLSVSCSFAIGLVLKLVITSKLG
jgi:hypothetical protein